MSSYAVLVVAVLLAIFLDFWVVRTWEHYKRLRSKNEGEQKAHTKSDLLAAARDETIKDLQLDKIGRLYRQKIAPHLNFYIILELVVLFLWAMAVSSPYLNMDERVIPAGREFNSAIQTHHLWTRAQECGWCAIWNGSIRGGYPAFVDIHGSALHPLVVVTTLVWGVVNGAKITLFLSFWLAGMAQWWLARELKVSALARFFTAGIAISGGHITSRMELGAFGVVLSIAMVSFVFPAVLYVLRRRDKTSIVILAIVLASAILSGQGYMQVGLILMSPAFLVLIWREKLNFQIWKNFGQAASIALLLAAPFLVPLVHFSSQIVKDSDPKFSFAQPIIYMPLNLVIENPSFYRSDVFDKIPYPHLTANFIGWIPVALAVIGAIRVNPENRQKVVFLLTGIILIYLTASAILLKWIALLYPSIGGVRHPTQISGLAVPLLLALGAYGIDSIKNLAIPARQETRFARVRSRLFWALIIPLLAIGLLKTYEFSTHWVYTVRVEPRVNELLRALETPSLTWVNPPFGEHIYVQPAIEAGLKISPGSMTWKWRDREIPPASLEANRDGPPSENSTQVNFVDGIPVYERTDKPYAAIYSEENFHPCSASGLGGQIRVECDAPQAGQLIVRENIWAGWQAFRDGQKIEIVDNSQYLQVHASAGRHIYQFNYLPWDVPAGIVFSFTGILMCLWSLRLAPISKRNPVKNSINKSTDKEHIMESQPEPSSLLERAKNNIKVRLDWRMIAEWALLACFALLITQPYLDFNEKVIPSGHEFGSVIQNHYLWTRAQECGWCALWNGSLKGGYPAFVDLHGSALHPLIIITTLIWGVINGTKVALLTSFWLAGVAQWWLARELKVSRLARVWTACMAITGGHLSSRMELGTVGLVYSTAMCSLALAALIHFTNQKNRKSIVLLAVAVASAILAGQGYMQLGLLLMSPALIFLIWDEKFNPHFWKKVATILIVTVLLSSVLLLPLLHFSPEISKWTNPNFSDAQPLPYIVLNLVINDLDYYRSEVLYKSIYPYMNGHFIGWIPVILAAIGLANINRENRRYLLFFASGVILVFLTSSATSLRWIEMVYPNIASIRFPPLISGLAIPLILGMAAYGFDVIRSMSWPKLWLAINHDKPEKIFQASLVWALIVPILFLSLHQTINFSKLWIYTTSIGPGVYEMVDSLQTPTSAWVNPPFGEHQYLSPAIAAGLKMSPGIMAWEWANQPLPQPRLEALRGGPPIDPAIEIKVADGVPIYLRENEHYAYVQQGDMVYPCDANGVGGKITVRCNTAQAGILTIQENRWTGWVAWQDGQRIELIDNPQLQVKASAGEHIYRFEYRPWDVPIGIILSLAGIFLCVWLWRKPEMPARSPGQENQEQQTQ